MIYINDLKVLYSKHYIKRDLFIIKVDTKVVMVYRSSGLSGTGHGGDIIPFMYLNDRYSMGISPGYIYKYMWYNNKECTHKKSFCGGIKLFLDNIGELVKDIHPEPHKEITTVDELLDLAKEINTELRSIIVQNELFDFEDVDYVV